MQNDGEHTSSGHLHNIMRVNPLTYTYLTTYSDDEHIAPEMTMTLPHLEGVPHAHIVTMPTFCPPTYGLTLLTSRELRWTSNLPQLTSPSEYLTAYENLSSFRSRQSTARTSTRFTNDKDTCTIHSHDFQGQTTIPAYHLFRAATILTMHMRLITLKHIYQNQADTNMEQLSQSTQALMHAQDSAQPATKWMTYAK